MNTPFPGTFIDEEALPGKQPFPGVTLQLAWGDRIMLSRVTFEPDGVVPEHSHPHEQAGIGISGRFELVVNGNARTIGPGEMYLIPGNTPHSARGIGEKAVTLDIFSPVREDYLPGAP